jgi:VCBS repeat protein
MSARPITAAVLLLLGLCAGCDFDSQLLACAKAERCLLPDAPRPVLRFPHNGAGLGSVSTITQLAWSPTRPYLVWDFPSNENTWNFRIQLNRCGPGQALSDCQFTTERSDQVPDTPATTYGLERDLDVGSRYWWRVRACQTALPGTPCGPWSDPRYFDVGRPESLPNDLAGTGRGELVVGQQNPTNAGVSETLYLFYGYNSGPSRWRETSIGPPGLGAPLSYGTVISGAGDLNGDGYTDLAVAYRPNFATGAEEAVPVHVFLSSPQGPGATGPIVLGPQSGQFGLPLGRAGDVNGDGYSDLAVCQAEQKQALVYFGGPNGPSNASSRSASLQVSNAQLVKPWCAFAALSDVDADGYDDIAVSGMGQVSVFRGREAFGPWTASVDIPAPVGATSFGASMAGGDFNGDGHGDLVVAGGNGMAYLYLGGPGWFSGQLPLPIAFNIGNGTVASAGDVNDDGYADLIAGGGSTGQVQIFLGQPSDAPKAGPIIKDAGLPNFGVSFAGGGDLTEDYYDDVVVGSTNGVIVYRGAPSENDLAVIKDPIIPPSGSTQFGITLAPAF